MLADQQQELAKVCSHMPNLPLSMKCFPMLLCKGLAVGLCLHNVRSMVLSTVMASLAQGCLSCVGYGACPRCRGDAGNKEVQEVCLSSPAPFL